MQKVNILSGNSLKLLAAAAMLIDHVGLIFFPQYIIFRIIGRLAFPIFAFMIAEGCSHTRSKLRYFLTMSILALVCQVVYFVALGDLKMSVFVTFSISILLVYFFNYVNKILFDAEYPGGVKIVALVTFFATLTAVYFINIFVNIDYGFPGCIMPLFASILRSDKSSPDSLKKLDKNHWHVLTMGACLLYMCCISRPIQFFSLLTLPLLLLYSGKRGKLKLKYFFYLFYPLHLVALYGIDLIIRIG